MRTSGPSMLRSLVFLTASGVTLLWSPDVTRAQAPRFLIDSAQFVVSTTGPDGASITRVTNRVPLDPSVCYGWRLHVSSNIVGALAWKEIFKLPAPPASWLGADSAHVSRDRTTTVTRQRTTPTDGWLSHQWCVDAGDPSGNYEMTVYVENRLVKRFQFVVAPRTAAEDTVVATVLGQSVRVSQQSNLSEIIFTALREQFAVQHGLASTPQEVRALLASGFPGTAEEGSEFVRSWKIAQALFRRYGGRVIDNQSDLVPFDAYRDFLKEHEQRGSFTILDERLRRSFWRPYLSDSAFTFLSAARAQAAFDHAAWEQPAPQPQGDSDTRKFVGLSVGSHYSCGLTPAGAAYCWGWNNHGQLGDGTTSDESRPVAVASRLSFAMVSAGSWYTCAVTAGGDAYCWGGNDHGQLGDGTTSDQSSPVLVGGGLHFIAVTTGLTHTCGITTDSAAYCWGGNTAGQLGDGTGPTLRGRSLPVPVVGGVKFTVISAGDRHTCGVATGGVAYCWGESFFGQLGDGTPTRSATVRSTPALVAGGMRYATLSSGGLHTCGITTGGEAYCWGDNDGQLGDGTPTPRITPVPVAGGKHFTALSAGAFHTCAVSTDSIAYCWGRNPFSQLGDGTTTNRLLPTPVAGGLRFIAVGAGVRHSCGLTLAGAAYCWGFNDSKQLGVADSSARSSPVLVGATAGAETVGVTMAPTPPAAPHGDPLVQLAGEWGLEAFVMGAGQFGGPRCGKSAGRGPPPVTLAAGGDGAVSFTASCDNGSEYSFRLGRDSAAQTYVLSVKSTPGISVRDFPLAYVDGQGWRGKRDELVDGKMESITAMVTPIEGRLWYGWMIAVLPTSGVGHEDDLKTPFFRADLTRRK